MRLSIRRDARRGSVLLVVVGMSMLVLGLALAFLVRMRSEAEENQLLVLELQARAMLIAGCDYVLEGARIGYDPRPDVVAPASNPRTHAEAYGWIDARPVFDGTPLDGPLDRNGQPLSPVAGPPPGGRGPRKPWPQIGSAVRCPMYVMERPPYATAQTATYNPMPMDPADPLFGKPYLRYPDPQPPAEATNGWPAEPPADPTAAAAAVNAANLAAWRAGDPRPRPQTAGRSWFRVYRESAAVFVITCGAGASQGFRDWADVTYPPSHADWFNNDQELFERIVGDEVRRWYRVEWSDSTGAIYTGGFVDSEILPLSYATTDPHNQRDWDHWVLHPVNASERTSGSHRNNIFRPNHCGTIKWVQRLTAPPAAATVDPDDVAW